MSDLSAGVVKRSVRIAGHPTSITLEPLFWNALRDIAAAEKRSIADLMTDIDKGRGTNNLSSALRLYVLQTLLQKTSS